MEIKIQIELTATDKVLNAIKHVTDMVSATKLATSSPADMKELVEAIGGAGEAPEKPAEAEVEQKPAETAKAAPAPQEEPEVTDDEMTDFIRVMKTKIPAADIKKVFAQYGCTSSTGCPKASRRAMMSDIRALAHA